MPTLDRTFPFAKMGNCATSISDNLHLDMSWRRQQLFDKNISIAKGLQGLCLAYMKSTTNFVLIKDSPHPPTAATSDRFDHGGTVSIKKCLRR